MLILTISAKVNVLFVAASCFRANIFVDLAKFLYLNKRNSLDLIKIKLNIKIMMIK